MCACAYTHINGMSIFCSFSIWNTFFTLHLKKNTSSEIASYVCFLHLTFRMHFQSASIQSWRDKPIRNWDRPHYFPALSFLNSPWHLHSVLSPSVSFLPPPHTAYSPPGLLSEGGQVWGWAQELCILWSWGSSVIADDWGGKTKITAA